MHVHVHVHIKTQGTLFVVNYVKIYREYLPTFTPTTIYSTIDSIYNCMT